jgi:putative transposon-encoded protein
MDIYYDNMRKIEMKKENFTLAENVELVYEKIVTRFGNSAKLDVPKKYIGMRAYVVIVKD